MAINTSISDNADYPGYCMLAAGDEAEFKRFRSHPQIVGIIEGIDGQAGLESINIALGHKPEYMARMEEFRRNDTVGEPAMSEYSAIGRFAPTTLRYIKFASELETLYGSLDGWRIAEIGGGYGGQCRILSVVADFQRYVIFDLEGPRRLTRRYLDQFDVANVEVKDIFDFTPEPFDLVISNYALSEIRKDVQDVYIEKILKNARHGFMVYNQAFYRQYIPTFSHPAQHILSVIPGAQLLPPERLPQADRNFNNVLIYW